MSEMEVPKEWKIIPLENLIELIMGQAPPGESYNKNQIGTPFVKVGEFGTSYPEIKIWTTKPLKFAQEGDVLLCVVGATTGKINLGINCAIGRSVASLRPNSKLFQKYLYYFLMSKIQRIRNSQQGSAMGIITKQYIFGLSIPLPQLEIQKKIVAKLDYVFEQLDEKKKEILSRIEQNKEQINFFNNNWFAYLIDNHIEKHPKRQEWKIHQLQDITNTIGDGIHKTPNYTNNSDFYFINGNNLRNGSIVITQNTKMVDKNEYQKYKIDLNTRTILLSINGTIGNLSFYKNEKVILGKSACYINCSDDLEPDFLFYLLQSNKIKKYFSTELTQTSIPNLSLKSVRKTPIPLPSISIQKQIVTNIKNIKEKLKTQKSEFENIQNQHELIKKHLNNLSSSILNDAFSGKLVR